MCDLGMIYTWNLMRDHSRLEALFVPWKSLWSKRWRGPSSSSTLKRERLGAVVWRGSPCAWGCSTRTSRTSGRWGPRKRWAPGRFGDVSHGFSQVFIAFWSILSWSTWAHELLERFRSDARDAKGWRVNPKRSFRLAGVFLRCQKANRSLEKTSRSLFLAWKCRERRWNWLKLTDFPCGLGDHGADYDPPLPDGPHRDGFGHAAPCSRRLKLCCEKGRGSPKRTRPQGRKGLKSLEEMLKYNIIWYISILFLYNMIYMIYIIYYI